MTEPTDAELQQLWQNSNPTNFEAISSARAVLQRWGQPSGAGNHPYAIQWDAELGRTAMRFVDRAGDVHPGIDDAETICAEFHAAMSAVIERMPHVQRMSTTPQPSPQAGAVPLTCEWTHNEDDGFWETACGEAWRFDDGGPGENNMHFCHSCGKSLRIKGKTK